MAPGLRRPALAPAPDAAVKSDPVLSLSRRVICELLGTAFLLVAVAGSGILAERSALGNIGIALLANSLATAAALYVLIEWLGPISGAHLNPLVSLMLGISGDVRWTAVGAYVPAQVVGALAGVAIANLMFDLPAFELSINLRSSPSHWLGEFVSTFGLVGVLWVCTRLRPTSLAAVVAAYIGGGFWFTPTGFANPAATLARAFTNSFSGIGLTEVPVFIAAEVTGAFAAVLIFSWILPMSQPLDCSN